MKATDYDHCIIDATSVALNGKIGLPDDVDRLYQQVVNVDTDSDKTRNACEIAVAFIRWAQDLKNKIELLEGEL